MQVNEGRARKMFVELSFKAADNWSIDKLAERLSKLPALLPNADKSGLSKESRVLLSACMEEIQEGNDLTVKPDDLSVLEEEIPGADADVETEAEEEVEEENKETSVATLDEEEEEEEAKDDKEGKAKGKKKKEPAPPPVVTKDNRIVEKSSKIVSISPKLAEKFANMRLLPGDRGITKWRKELRKKQILDGEFRGASWVSAKVKEDGNVYRINGNHTSNAAHELYLAGANFDYFKISVYEFECETLDDAAKLYEAYDPASGTRTKGNLLQTHAHAVATLSKVDNKVIKIATAALAKEEWDTEARKHDVREQAENMAMHTDFVLWLEKLLSKPKKGKAPTHLTRVPVVQAIFNTYNAVDDKSVVSKFWASVKDGENADKGSVQWVLYNYLISHVLGAGRSKEGVTRVQDMEMHFMCISAWNAWRKDDKWKPPAYKVRDGIPTAL